ncbi:hypothetical protein DFH11DRAFT_1704425, partial [Phellopilus nigrolimitatus]
MLPFRVKRVVCARCRRSDVSLLAICAPRPSTQPNSAGTSAGVVSGTRRKPQHGGADTYYGHEEASEICLRLVAHTFNFSCPELLPSHFVAYAFHRTRLHASVTFTASVLLHPLKMRFPVACGSSGHRIFLTGFMIASKVVYDDIYSNKSWAVVRQGLFALREINQMEREMCAYIEWQLNIPGENLRAFEAEVPHIYCRPPPYTHYV